MTNKLYVGSLAYSVSTTQLQEIFEQHGAVKSAKVISDRVHGRSRGFGFVEMASKEEARKARKALNGTELEGRKLVVNEARPQKKTRPGVEARLQTFPVHHVRKKGRENRRFLEQSAPTPLPRARA